MRTPMICVLMASLLAGCQSTAELQNPATARDLSRERYQAPFGRMIANADSGETLIGQVYFNYDGSELSGEAKRMLDDMAYGIAKGDYPVIVEGHADHNNTDDYNIRLGYERAIAVANHLRSAGVWDERIHVKSFGEERPAASNWADATRAMNRRVVIKKFVDGEGMGGERALKAHTKSMTEKKSTDERLRGAGINISFGGSN